MVPKAAVELGDVLSGEAGSSPRSCWRFGVFSKEEVKLIQWLRQCANEWNYQLHVAKAIDGCIEDSFGKIPRLPACTRNRRETLIKYLYTWMTCILI